MHRALLLLLIAPCLFLVGCDTLQKKHDSPVMAAAPRRVAKVESDETDDTYADANSGSVIPKEDDGSDVQQVRATLSKKNPWDDWKDDTAIFNSQVAATVNGAPILNGDVLDQYSGYLISVREELQKIAADPKLMKPGMPEPTPQFYEQMRYSLIQRDIANHIRSKLLVERLKAGMKPEQLKALNNHIDDEFAKRVQDLKKELKVSNKTELELALNKKGTTLQNVKDNFALERLSMECIVIKSKKPDPIERPDLVAYYQSHPELFTFESKVKWQQIQVTVAAPGTDTNKKEARKKLEQAIDELNRGKPFEQVAKKYSDGPTAKDGGAWDWMTEGNLADTKLEKKLFSMPVNRLSEIHEGPGAYSVVRVTEREMAGRKPFKEVQSEIKQIMESEQNSKRAQAFLKEVFSTAFIETTYSLPQFVPEEE